MIHANVNIIIPTRDEPDFSMILIKPDSGENNYFLVSVKLSTLR